MFSSDLSNTGMPVELAALFKKAVTFESVIYHGADPTGRSDDTKAFQRALATSSNVYVPSGTYNITSATISTDGQVLFGDGEKTIINQRDPAVDVFNVTSAYNRISGFRFNGAAINDSTGSFGIICDTPNSAPYLEVDHIHFTGVSSDKGFNNAVKVNTGSDYVRFHHNIIERLWGSISGTGYGFLMGNVQFGEVSENIYIGGVGRSRHMVYLSSGASFNHIHHNKSFNCNQRAYNEASTTGQPTNKYNTFESNLSYSAPGDANGVGFGISGQNEGSRFISNIVHSPGGDAIVIDGTDYSNSVTFGQEIKQNRIYEAGQCGIRVIVASNVEIANNRVFDCSQAAANTHSNITIQGDGALAPDGTYVANNYSYGTSKARAAFEINGGAPLSTNTKLIGNYFPLCAVYGISLNSAIASIDNDLVLAGQTWNPTSIANGAELSKTFTLPGAKRGDIISASLDVSLKEGILGGYCSADNTVILTINNNTGGAIDIDDAAVKIHAERLADFVVTN